MCHVLLIDDDELFRCALAAVIRNLGHFVTEAADGRVGCRLLDYEQVDVVLTDIIMPEKDGVETIIEIIRKFPRTALIAMSGQSEYLQLDLLHLARGLGVKQVLAKPFTSEQLRAAIDASLGGAIAGRTIAC